MYNRMVETEWIPADEVRRYAKQHRISERRLERWRKADLIPRPRRIHLGKGKGTRSEYPAGVLNRLLAVKRIRATERRLVYIRFILWAEGESIPLQALRACLKKLTTSKTHKRKDMVQAFQSMGLLRSQADARIVGNAFADLSQGRDPGFEVYDYGSAEGEPRLTDLMMNTVGLSRVQKDNDASIEPCFPEVGLALNDLAEGRYLSSQVLSATLNTATTQDFSTARSDACILLYLLPMYSQSLREDGYRGARVVKKNARVMALFILGMLQFRKTSELGSTIDMFACDLQNAGIEIPSLAQFVQK